MELTKFEHILLEKYKRAEKRTLQDCYTRYSRNKEIAMEYCISDFMEHEGYDARIPSYNTFGFTFAYVYDIEICQHVETHLRYLTKDNIYDFIINRYELVN